MPRPGRPPRSPRTWVAVAVVAVLAVGVVGLSVLALQRTRPDSTSAVETLTPSLKTPPRTPSPAATSTGTPTPAVTVTAPAGVTSSRADERLLTGSGGVLWRATAGACGGAAPVVERSTDDGATWSTVTPTYRSLAQIQTLDTLAGTQAQLVGAVGASCETQALRTFTQGQFWESHPATLAASRYPFVATPSRIAVPSGTIVAPCDDPRSFHADGTVMAAVCAGTARVSTGGSWLALPPVGVRALTIDDENVVVGYTAAGCAGITLARLSGADWATSTPLGCAPAAEPDAPLALAVVSGQVRLWSADRILTLA